MPVGTMYRVRVLSKLRAGFPPNSKDLGSVPVGTVLKALEQRKTATGIERVRFANVSAAGVLQGWVSLKASGAPPLPAASAHRLCERKTLRSLCLLAIRRLTVYRAVDCVSRC